MSLIPRYPFWDIDRFFKESEWPEQFEKLLPKVFQIPMIRTPRIDIYETGGNIVIEIELPGVDPKNIEVEVKDNILKVEAKAEEKKEEKGKGYYRKEISTGYYRRVFPLPVEVVEGKSNATYKEGILKVVIPQVKGKKAEKKGTKIKIKTKTA